MIILQFLFNLLYLLDLALNFILLGDPSETISSRTGRAMASGRPKWFVPYLAKFIDTLFFFEPNHSIENIEYDEDYEHELWSWIKKENK